MAVLKKIAETLAMGGVFCGSESLGRSEGTDHVQYFDSEEDFRRLLGSCLLRSGLER